MSGGLFCGAWSLCGGCDSDGCGNNVLLTYSVEKGTCEVYSIWVLQISTGLSSLGG